MPRIYLTQKHFDNVPHDQKTETTIITPRHGTLPYTIMPPRKTLTCSVCSVQTKGRQWYNRDKGVGICPTCHQDEYARAINNGSTNDDLADLQSSYGIYGVHYGKLSDFILQG